MNFVSGFDSKIRFPKKKNTAQGFEEVLARHDKSIIDSYQLTHRLRMKYGSQNK